MDEFHPESPDRLKSIYGMLGIIDQAGLLYVPARSASEEEIEWVHDPRYVTMVRETSGKGRTRLDPDTSTSPKSYDASCMAAGGVLKLVDSLMKGEIDNGFALVRPPGHHAEKHRAMGFCIFNNIAIGARYLEYCYGRKRIMIVDFDLHHGNGTQQCFYADNSVLYISTHQYPYYPGSGWYDEIGHGLGKGYTINIPLSNGMHDGDYEHVFEEIVAPVSRLFAPEVILVSAGYDIHASDPLGGMKVTESGFSAIARTMMNIAGKECDGKLLFVLEGGYNLVALANGVRATIMEMRKTPLHFEEANDRVVSRAAVEVVSKVKQTIEPYWGNF
jgi:acetoin utilization deacetylase AcuC-like enzyme